MEARGAGPPSAWTALEGPACAGMLAELAGIDAAPAPSHIERLRRTHDPATVTAAIELSVARTKAAAKFGAPASRLWCDRAGVEMASAPEVARWKAARFRAAGAERIDDLCCGIGGDLMALADVAPTVGVDLDPLRAWMAERNAGSQVRCADALHEPGTAPFAHVDPARRSGGARLVRGDDLLPPLSALLPVLRARRGAAAKLGPGMDLEPGERAEGDEVEFVSHRGTLVQQVLWMGALATAPGTNTATQADAGRTITGIPGPPPAGAGMARMLLVPDPALERARLLHVAAHATRSVDAAPGLGILTADRAPDGDWAQWLEAHQVIEELPARERTVAAWLAARGAGIVTVRTRGGACDPDAWQRALRGPGDQPWTVFVLRMGDERRAYAVRRVDA